MYENERTAYTDHEVMTDMYRGRTLDELTGVPVPQWELNELTWHHLAMSQMSPLMNSQGVSLHHQIIQEIERRGELQAEGDHPATDGEAHSEHRFTF